MLAEFPINCFSGSLFNQVDAENNNEIPKTELEKLIHSLNFGEFQPNYDWVVKELFKDLEKDGNNVINEPESINGLKELVNEALAAAKHSDEKKSADEIHKESSISIN